jgi:hypothetical protein
MVFLNTNSIKRQIPIQPFLHVHSFFVFSLCYEWNLKEVYPDSQINFKIKNELEFDFRILRQKDL